MTYADLAKVEDAAAILGQAIRPDVTLTPVRGWKTLGQSVSRPNARDLVTGAHRFPSDVVRPGNAVRRVLRGPAYGATLESVDLIGGEGHGATCVAVREGPFVGFAAPSSFRAAQALEAAARTASWKTSPRPVSNENLFEHLRANARKRRGAHRREGLGRDGPADRRTGSSRSPIASPSSSTPRWSPAPRWPSGTGTA